MRIGADSRTTTMTRMTEVLEGPPDEDEARTEVLILSFSRTRTRPRVRYTNFRDRGRDEDLASIFALFLGNFED